MSIVHGVALGGGVLSFMLLASAPARADEAAGPLDRTRAIAIAVASHPALRAGEQRARAAALRGTSAGSLPPPEAMVQVWQVPIDKPYAVNEGQMIMFGVGQTIPAAGSRGARERAAGHDAAAERALTADRSRLLRREVDHAFADYVEATSRHRVHLEHRAVASRAVDLARARHAGGASLLDVAQAEVELARMEADVVTDGTRIESARRRLNALLGRDPLAGLGPPVVGEPETAGWDVGTALESARASRAELRASDANQAARTEEARAADREASIPSFTVAGLYFAPTTPMPHHGYGVNASMSLPWLWGEASGRRDALRESARAAASDAGASRLAIAADVAKEEANVRASALRLQALRDRALPASRRAFEIVWSSYESSRADVLAVIATRRAVVDVESEIVIARASLDHSLADLEAAVGREVPRKALGPFDPKVLVHE